MEGEEPQLWVRLLGTTLTRPNPWLDQGESSEGERPATWLGKNTDKKAQTRSIGASAGMLDPSGEFMVHFDHFTSRSPRSTLAHCPFRFRRCLVVSGADPVQLPKWSKRGACIGAGGEPITTQGDPLGLQLKIEGSGNECCHVEVGPVIAQQAAPA